MHEEGSLWFGASLVRNTLDHIICKVLFLALNIDFTSNQKRLQPGFDSTKKKTIILFLVKSYTDGMFLYSTGFSFPNDRSIM